MNLFIDLLAIFGFAHLTLTHSQKIFIIDVLLGSKYAFVIHLLYNTNPIGKYKLQVNNKNT